MREPTREEAERRFPQLKADSEWKLFPVVNTHGSRIGFVGTYRIGGREFATPIFWAEAAGGEG